MKKTGRVPWIDGRVVRIVPTHPVMPEKHTPFHNTSARRTLRGEASAGRTSLVARALAKLLAQQLESSRD